jgi:hypothetical protein
MNLSMSGTTLVQETLSLEGADPCQILVLYEDAAAHDVAMEVCGRVLAHFEAELAFAFSFWKFKDLDNPVSAHWAAKAVARADVILFSMPAHDLSPETMNWLDMCVQARTKAEGALAVMVTEHHDMDLVVEALLSRLQFAAQRLRMDFLPLLPTVAGTRFGTSAELSPAWLDEVREEAGSSHWGLNE